MMVYLFLKILSVLFLLLLRFQFDGGGGEMSTLRAQSASPFESRQHRHRVRFAHYRGGTKEAQLKNSSEEIFDIIENTVPERSSVKEKILCRIR